MKKVLVVLLVLCFMAGASFAGKNGATFLVDYPIDDFGNANSRATCRWFVPVGDYR